MTDKYYIGWVRSGKDGKGLVKSRPRKRIANAVTVYMVQKYVDHFPFGKWVNIKGFSDKQKAVALMSLLYNM